MNVLLYGYIVKNIGIVLVGLLYPLAFVNAHTTIDFHRHKDPIQEQAKEAMSKAVSYLLGKQEKSGAWPGNHGGPEMNLWESKLAHTCIVAKALLASREIDPKRIDEALANVIKWLDKYQGPGRQTFQLQDSGYGHIFAIEFMLDLLDREQTLVTKEGIQKIISERLKSLAASMVKNSDGQEGWGYKQAPTAFITGAALQMLQRAKAHKIEVDEKMIQSSVKLLKELEIHPFYYLYEALHLKGDKFAKMRDPEYVEGSTGRVCSITTALYLSGEKKKEDIEKSIEIFFKYYDSLDKARQKGGNKRNTHISSLHGASPYCYLYGNYYAAVAIRYLPEEPRKKYSTMIQDALCKIQKSDGTWIDFTYIGHVYGTGMGLLAIAELQKNPIEAK